MEAQQQDPSLPVIVPAWKKERDAIYKEWDLKEEEREALSSNEAWNDFDQEKKGKTLRQIAPFIHELKKNCETAYEISRKLGIPPRVTIDVLESHRESDLALEGSAVDTVAGSSIETLNKYLQILSSEEYMDEVRSLDKPVNLAKAAEVVLKIYTQLRELQKAKAPTVHAEKVVIEFNQIIMELKKRAEKGEMPGVAPKDIEAIVRNSLEEGRPMGWKEPKWPGETDAPDPSASPTPKPPASGG